MMNDQYEKIRAQLTEIERLAEHLTADEKMQLAESLGAFPQRYLTGLGGWHIFLCRERLIAKLAGCPLHVLAILPSLAEKISAEEIRAGVR